MADIRIHKVTKIEIKKVDKGSKETVFYVNLDERLETDLEAFFVEDNGDRTGAYYVYIEYFGK